MRKRESKLIRVGKSDVKSALGFFWQDNYKIYVAESTKDIEDWGHTHEDASLHPMWELEQAFKDSDALRYISWCSASRGAIVRQGAHQVTFEYTTHKSVMHIK